LVTIERVRIFTNKLKKQYMTKIIDGMVYDSETDKWVTIEEYNKEYDKIECSADQDWEWHYASE